MRYISVSISILGEGIAILATIKCLNIDFVSKLVPNQYFVSEKEVNIRRFDFNIKA